MATYVRSARYAADGSRNRAHVTGEVLHLATWTYDEPGTTLAPGTGRWAPLCRGGEHVEVWRITGEWADGWEGHAHWRVCARCTRKLAELLADLADQQKRADAHAAQLAAHWAADEQAAQLGAQRAAEYRAAQGTE